MTKLIFKIVKRIKFSFLDQKAFQIYNYKKMEFFQNHQMINICIFDQLKLFIYNFVNFKEKKYLEDLRLLNYCLFVIIRFTIEFRFFFISLSRIYQDTPVFVLYTDLHSGFDSTPKNKVLMIRFFN